MGDSFRNRLRRFFGAPGDGFRAPWRVFWVALAVRVLFITLAHTFRLRVIHDHFEFGWEMGRIARALVTGYGYADPFNGHSGPTAWTPPLYPMLLAGVFRMFGVYSLMSGWVILTINSVFSAAIAPLIYEISLRCFARGPAGMKVALWASWLWALYPAAMQYAVKWVWDISLSALLFTGVILLALRIRGIGDEPLLRGRGKNRALWMAFGVVWGLVALSNSSLLIFLPACGLWAAWERFAWRGAAFAGLRNVTLGASCCLAVVSPWEIRNFRVFHEFVPLRSNLGAELYKSVQPENGPFPWGGTLPLAPTQAEFLRYKRIGEIAYCKEQGRRALPFIRGNKRIFFGYMVQRIDFFWVSVPHPIDKGVLVEAVRELNYAFLSFGGLLGLALAVRRNVPGAWLFFWAFLFVPLLCYAITVQARFRHPLEPIIAILIVYLFQSAELPGESQARSRRSEA